MKRIIQFVACDGSKFNSESDCVKHENKIHEIKKIMSTLNQITSECDFLNGGGYVMQDIPTVEKAMVRIAEMAGIEKKPEFINNPFSCRFGIIGRIIDDSGDSDLWRAWGRFMNMDYIGREWGQRYYAQNPEQGRQKDLTNRALKETA